ncbi:peptide-methionine (S)-S-oxide reductase MsrA [Flavobacterium microcysteis]|uniref:Peptide methionine sulfoxide reductase MsrA n=1 Tax=Flavobacterium microcysteis TaxID=2596891 RepID=A0A501Q440_9FLAO|nr:peptide-methionine (S)-S-oxide reductase MsrA [Flavobacterium microcysteis]TPD67094.1 peptide-methionine (S)-S-oxide reductase MsrA [Flavobacterium microcysteis]
MKKMIGLLTLITISCQSKEKEQEQLISEIKEPVKMEVEKGLEIATFGGGCFWCTEAIFLELDGVKKVESGYTGGKTVNPTYEEVSTGTTGHAEATQITFDPNKISFGELLEIFFATHDPTTLNRQGADIGTQYRSEIFYHNDEQKRLAEEYIKLLDAENTFGKPVVTKVSPAGKFYVAENYHQNYYARNKEKSYCSYVITPKVEKVRKQFAGKLKK